MQKHVLILQGERDTFGTREEIAAYNLSNNIEVCYLTDGDHNLKPRKKSGVTLEQNLDKAVKQTVSFIQSVIA
jgi:predicted alpha/beta-hydrolase family hydrolase